MRYTFEQRKKAVELYIECGRSVSAVRAKLGYPSRQAMYDWYADYVERGFRPDHRPHRKFTDEQKRAVIYKWKRGLLGMGKTGSFSDFELSDDPVLLKAQVVELQREVRRLRLQKDILQGVADILKKRRAPTRRNG